MCVNENVFGEDRNFCILQQKINLRISLKWTNSWSNLALTRVNVWVIKIYFSFINLQNCQTLKVIVVKVKITYFDSSTRTL